MKILSLNFLIYTVCGIWQPLEWTSAIACLLYNVFTIVAVSLVYIFTLTSLLDLIFVVDTVNDFVTNSFMCITLISVCCKATSVVIRRKKIINLINTLEKEPCKPRDKEEKEIQGKFDRFIRLCTIRYTILAEAAAFTASMRAIASMMRRQLPYRAWLPYDYTTAFSFWFTSIQQMITIIIATTINIGSETLIFGLIMHTCTQLEILQYRFQKLGKLTACEMNINDSLQVLQANRVTIELSNCIRHHLNIFKYAESVNDVFDMVLFVQFFSSIIVLCSSVFYLSMCKLQSVEFITLAVYTSCMFVQIFVYCWSGNEVMLKSESVGDAVYHVDWTLMTVNERKSLLIVMKRCTQPIKFTSSFLVALTLNSYTNILKASYSAYNLLK